MTRISSSRLVDLANELSGREREITQTVERLRLLSGKQLERLYFAETTNPSSQARLTRRTLARLVERRLLDRLERRIGGVRAGAAGHVYFATPGAQRLVSYWQGKGTRRVRSRYEPTKAFVRHTLAIAESYVRLVEADRAGTLELLAFQSEPDVWRSFVGPGGARLFLKPDALVRVGVSSTEEERAFLEIDCGTEGRAALTRKCRTYLMAWHAGIEPDVFPRVLFVTTTEQRVRLLNEVCASLPPEARKLFSITTPERALAVLTVNGVSS
jgi:hypothetical protein